MLETVIFYCFAVLAILSGLAMICSRNPVKSALFLVLAFVCAAPLWLMAQAEFLALVLIFVYVGAVMTLFLFVVMMLNLDNAPRKEGFVRYLPFAVIIAAVLLVIMLYALKASGFAFVNTHHIVEHGIHYSNIKALGSVLYTYYLIPLEIAAVILLVAIIAAINLAYQGVRDRKSEVPEQQINVQAKNRVRIVKMPAEKKL